ncbi:hypothetical protein BH09PSE5_BH09PSE5_11680 [soil metagenome]
MKTKICALISLVVGGFTAAAHAQQVENLRDLQGLNPVKLSADEVKALVPDSKVTRVTPAGNTTWWTNEAAGSFFATSDNRSYGNARATTAPGKWNLTDDGRYCVVIEWKGVATEQWCRYLFKTADAYYGSTSDGVGTTKVYKMTISK